MTALLSEDAPRLNPGDRRRWTTMQEAAQKAQRTAQRAGTRLDVVLRWRPSLTTEHYRGLSVVALAVGLGLLLGHYLGGVVGVSTVLLALGAQVQGEVWRRTRVARAATEAKEASALADVKGYLAALDQSELNTLLNDVRIKKSEQSQSRR